MNPKVRVNAPSQLHNVHAWAPGAAFVLGHWGGGGASHILKDDPIICLLVLRDRVTRLVTDPVDMPCQAATDIIIPFNLYVIHCWLIRRCPWVCSAVRLGVRPLVARVDTTFCSQLCNTSLLRTLL